MRTEAYEHFHPDERAFVDKAEEWIGKSSVNHMLKITDFLDPRQCQIVEMLANRESRIQVLFKGGYVGAERQRAVIAPIYSEIEQVDIGIQILSVFSNDRGLHTLSHRDYMGSILSLGIKRDKIGDILVHEQGCHCIATAEIMVYLHLQLQQVRQVHVQTEILPLDKLIVPQKVMAESSHTVASLRLDVLVSEVVKLSRAKVLNPIRSGKCRVNWKIELDASKQLKTGDTISLQGFGRFQLLQIEGMTKKSNIRIKVGKYI